MNWDDADGPFFNPPPTISTVPLPGGLEVVVVDDVLLDPQGLVEWARTQTFGPPGGFPYPGVIVAGPTGLSARFADFFVQHALARLQECRRPGTGCSCTTPASSIPATSLARLC